MTHDSYQRDRMDRSIVDAVDVSLPGTAIVARNRDLSELRVHRLWRLGSLATRAGVALPPAWGESAPPLATRDPSRWGQCVELESPKSALSGTHFIPTRVEGNSIVVSNVAGHHCVDVQRYTQVQPSLQPCLSLARATFELHGGNVPRAECRRARNTKCDSTSRVKPALGRAAKPGMGAGLPLTRPACETCRHPQFRVAMSMRKPAVVCDDQCECPGARA
jgi:hypothetical protein